MNLLLRRSNDTLVSHRYNAKQVRDTEKARWNLVNPARAAREQADFEDDKAGVDRRRRDRYPVYFSEKDAKEAALAAL